MAERKKTAVNPEIAEAKGNSECGMRNAELTIPQSPAVTASFTQGSHDAEAKGEYVDSFIFPTVPGESGGYFECSVNCVKYKFPKGVPVRIPKCVYDLYVCLNKDILTANAEREAMPRNV